MSYRSFWESGYAYSPVPVKGTNLGLAGSEVTMLMVPRRKPGIAGLKVTAMVQLAPAATLGPQVLLWSKSMPETKISLTCKLAEPLSVSVMV